MSTNRVKRQKDSLRELLALQRKAANSARECPDCGERPLAHEPLSLVFVADADEGMCIGCAAILADAGIPHDDIVIQCPPRGLPAESGTDAA